MKRDMVRNLFASGMMAFLLFGIGLVSSFGQAHNGAEYRLTGYVVRIDRNSRMLVVRDRITGRDVRVFVPADRNVTLSSSKPMHYSSSIVFERVLRGMMVDLIVTKTPFNQGPAGVND